MITFAKRLDTDLTSQESDTLIQAAQAQPRQAYQCYWCSAKMHLTFKALN